MSHKDILKVGWSLVGYSPRGRKESDTTEAAEHTHIQARCLWHLEVQCESTRASFNSLSSDQLKTQVVFQSTEPLQVGTERHQFWAMASMTIFDERAVRIHHSYLNRTQLQICDKWLRNLLEALSTSGMISFSRKSETDLWVGGQVLERKVLLFMRFSVRKAAAQGVF